MLPWGELHFFIFTDSLEIFDMGIWKVLLSLSLSLTHTHCIDSFIFKGLCQHQVMSVCPLSTPVLVAKPCIFLEGVKEKQRGLGNLVTWEAPGVLLSEDHPSESCLDKQKS